MAQETGSLHPDRMAPHSVEAEESVLGSILLNPDSLFEVASFLKTDDFFIVRNGWVWDAIMRLHHRDEQIDNITVAEELRQQGRLDDVGGVAYITYLINHTPSSIYTETYGRIVERAAIRRRMLESASEIAKLAHEEAEDIDDVIDKAEASLFRVTEQRQRKEIVAMDEAIADYFDRIEYLYSQDEQALGVPTGFKDLDQLLGGLQKSDLLIFAGRPGMGKTAWMLSVALNAARAKQRIAIFSLEMGVEQIVQRLVSSETGISSQDLRLGQLEDREWGLFVEATDKLAPLKIFMDDSPALSPLQLRTKCRRLYSEHGLDLVIIDYLQLMHGGAGSSENRVQEISFISRQLKQLARELNVPVLAAAQLSRAVEQRTDKRPQLSDLRESGSIEQDADIVMFIYRDEVYNENTEVPNQADIIVAKHRNGPTGVISLYFRKELTQFADLAKTNVDFAGY